METHGDDGFTTPDFKSYGVRQIPGGELTGHLRQGERGTEYLVDERLEDYFEVMPGQWYYLLLASDGDGCLIVLVDKDRHNQVAWMQHDFDANWQGREWLLFFAVKEGSLFMEEYYRLEFDEIQFPR
jgi:hypothetical protein